MGLLQVLMLNSSFKVSGVAALAYQPFSWGLRHCVGRRMGLLQV